MLLGGERDSEMPEEPMWTWEQHEKLTQLRVRNREHHRAVWWHHYLALVHGNVEACRSMKKALGTQQIDCHHHYANFLQGPNSIHNSPYQ